MICEKCLVKYTLSTGDGGGVQHEGELILSSRKAAAKVVVFEINVRKKNNDPTNNDIQMQSNTENDPLSIPGRFFP